MKSETRRAKLAALLARGEDDEILKLASVPKQEHTFAQQQTSRDAEAVLGFVLTPKRFIKRLCRNCESQFYTDYSCVAYCSDSCRRHAMETLGIKWDPTKPPEQRWGNPVPLVIPGNTLEFLRKCLDLTQSQDIPLPEPLQELTHAPESNGHSPELPEFHGLLDLDLEFDL